MGSDVVIVLGINTSLVGTGSKGEKGGEAFRQLHLSEGNGWHLR